MKRAALYLRHALVVAFVLRGLAQAQSGSKPDDIVSRHLDSIAPQSARAAEKSRVIRGNLRFRVIVGGSGGAIGSWDLVSSGRMLNMVMRFGMGDWRGEQFISDGSRTNVAMTTAAHLRSDFGQFVAGEDFLLKEGLLGGELSTGWSLQNLQANDARVENRGPKKVHGKKLIALEYSSRRSSDMHVKIYVDPDTYHHLYTVYSMERTQNATGDIRTSSMQKVAHYTMEEQFDDFQVGDGFTLPRHYSLQWTEELQNGLTRIFEWDLTATQIREDVPLDPANFEVK